MFWIPLCHSETINTKNYQLNIETVVDGLDHPWGIAFLPDGDSLITERSGKLRKITSGKLLEQAVTGLPVIKEKGQGGLLGIALHPDYKNNQLVYLSYAGQEEGGYGTEVVRGKLQGMKLNNVQKIFTALPKSRGGRHFGSRLVFANDGTLFISLGDRGKQDTAQDINDHRGSLIRINDDGSIPKDNPFIDRENAKPEIYTYGNRNMQGMALNIITGEIWTHEHGPQGGDEVNIMRAGVNYGWPVITYGVNYGIGTKIGEGTHKHGMEQPIHKWVPSIAPSGMTFYTGKQFSEWKGDLFVGSLKFGLLVRLEIHGNKIVGEERMLHGKYGRIRDVVEGPEGSLYILTDEHDGKLLKISNNIR